MQNQLASAQPRPTLCLWLMIALLLLACALGAAGLNMDVVWVDEMYGLGNMGAFNPPYSPAQVVASLAQYSPDQMPLYYALGSQWGLLVGWSQLPMRYLSLLFGALLIACSYRFAADAFDRRTALLASCLLCSNALLLWHFHEMRMYTLWPLLFMAHLWLYWRMVKGEGGNRLGWAVFVLSAAAVMHTQAFAVFFFAGLGLQHLLCHRRSARFWMIWRAWLAGGILSLPMLPSFIDGLRGYHAPSSVARHHALANDEAVIHLGRALVNDMGVLWLAIAALGAYAIFRQRDRSAIRLLVIAALATLGILIAHAVFPVISPTRIRYFAPVIPLFTLLAARFLLAWRWRSFAAPAFLLLWAWGAAQLLDAESSTAFFGHASLRMDHPPMHRYVDGMQGKTRDQDYLLGFAASPMISWNLKHGWSPVEYYLRFQLGIDGDIVNMRLKGDALLADLDTRLKGQPYLLAALDRGRQPEPDSRASLLDAIAARYQNCGALVDEAGGLFIQRFVHPMIACERAYQPIHYERGIRIVDKFAAYDETSETVRIVTGWEVDDEALLERYNVSLQILAGDWSLRGQEDQHLYAIGKWYTAELSTASLEPGQYRAVVIVYDRDHSSGKLSGSDMQTGETGTILPLLRFEIK